MTRLLLLLTALCALAVAQPAAAAESFDLFPSSSATGQRHTLAKPLEEGKKYTVTVSGTIHNESTLDTGLSRDFDALWKYDCRRTDEDGGPGPNLCSPEVWPGVQIGERDQPASDYPSFSTTGQTVAARPPVNEAHSYSLLIDKVPAPGITYLRAYGSFDDPDWTYSGSLHVTIEEFKCETVAKITAVEPEVETRQRGEKWKKAEVGDELCARHEIVTDPDGTATLEFADGTIDVRPMSQIYIAQWLREGGLIKTEILLRLGEAAAEVKKSGAIKSDFSIRSPTATASTRGTKWTMSYDPFAKVTLVSVTESEVEVDPLAAGLATTIVGAGKEIEVGLKKVSAVAPIGKAGTPKGGLPRAKARALVAKILSKANGPCKLTVKTFGLKAAKKGWLASAKVSGKAKGTASWSVIGKKVKAKNAVAKKLGRNCR